MTGAAPEARQALMDAAAQIDILDLCGRIIARPERAMVSLAAKVAMAQVIERMWELCIEADLLVNALERAMPWATTDDEHHEHVANQMAAVRDLMAALRGETPDETRKEETDGTD